MSRYKQLNFLDKLYPNDELNIKYPGHKWTQCEYDHKKYECDNCYLSWTDNEFIVLSRYGLSYPYDDKIIYNCDTYNKFVNKLDYLNRNQMNIISKRKYKKFSIQHQLTVLCIKNNWPPFWISKGHVWSKEYSIRRVDGATDLPFHIFKGHVNSYLYNIAQLDNFSLTIAKNRNDPELDKLINKWTMMEVMS